MWVTNRRGGSTALMSYLSVSCLLWWSLQILSASLLSSTVTAGPAGFKAEDVTSTPSNSTVKEATVSLYAAGGTLPADLLKRVNRLYYRSTLVSKVTTTTQILYDPVGSGLGRSRFLSNALSFGVVDAPLQQADFTSFPDLMQIPLCISAVVPVFNIPTSEVSLPTTASSPSPTPTKMLLSREVLGRIFLGNITWWNDSLIQALNPELASIPHPITVVVRADKSGTTQVMTTALGSFYPAFKNHTPSSQLPNWCGPTAAVERSFTTNNATFQTVTCSSSSLSSTYGASWHYLEANGTAGVAITVQMIPYSIGYVALSEALTFKMATPRMINRAGAIVEANPTSVMAAVVAVEANFDEHWVVPIIDTPTASAWPIISISYLLLRTDITCNSCLERKAFLDWSHWVLTSLEFKDIATASGFVMLTEYMRMSIDSDLQTRLYCSPTCPGSDLSTSTTIVVCDCSHHDSCQVVSRSSAGSSSSVMLTLPSFLESFMITFYDSFNNEFGIRVSSDLNNDLGIEVPTASQDPSGKSALSIVTSQSLLYATRTTNTDLLDDMIIIPLFMLPVSLTFNLEGVKTLNVTRAILADIFRGTITEWNDARLAAINAQFTLPTLRIQIIIDDFQSLLALTICRYLEALDVDFFRDCRGLKVRNVDGSNIRALYRDELVSAAVSATIGALGCVWTSPETVQASLDILPDDIGASSSVTISPSSSILSSSIAALKSCSSTLSTTSVIQEVTQQSNGYGARGLVFRPSYAAYARAGCWPITMEFNLMIRRQWEENDRSVATAYAQFAQWAVATDLGMVVPAPLLIQNESNFLLRGVKVGVYSILKPEPLCELRDMQVTVSTALCTKASQDLAITFSWRPGTYCLNGQQLFNNQSVECPYLMFGSKSSIGLLIHLVAATLLTLGLLVMLLRHQKRVELASANIGAQTAFLLASFGRGLVILFLWLPPTVDSYDYVVLLDGFFATLVAATLTAPTIIQRFGFLAANYEDDPRQSSSETHLRRMRGLLSRLMLLPPAAFMVLACVVYYASGSSREFMKTPFQSVDIMGLWQVPVPIRYLPMGLLYLTALWKVALSLFIFFLIVQTMELRVHMPHVQHLATAGFVFSCAELGRLYMTLRLEAYPLQPHILMQHILLAEITLMEFAWFVPKVIQFHKGSNRYQDGDQYASNKININHLCRVASWDELKTTLSKNLMVKVKFRQFLVQQTAEEYLMVFDDVMRLREIDNAKRRSEIMQEITRRYITGDAPFPVRISDGLRESILLHEKETRSSSDNIDSSNRSLQSDLSLLEKEVLLYLLPIFYRFVRTEAAANFMLLDRVKARTSVASETDPSS